MTETAATYTVRAVRASCRPPFEVIVPKGADKHGDPAHPGYWLTPKGRFIPAQNVSPYDQRKEAVLLPLCIWAEEIAAQLVAFKAWAFQAWCDFDGEAAAEYGVDILTEKGNGTAYLYNGAYKVTMKSAGVLEFDNRLNAARELIKQCLDAWLGHSAPEATAIIASALEINANGLVNVRKVLGLRRLKIDDERWQAAMQAVNDAVQEVGRASYLQIYRRKQTGDRLEWENVPLSLAAA